MVILVKDPYILDFLASDPVRERDLYKALTDNLARFLREPRDPGSPSWAPRRPGPAVLSLPLHRYVVFELKLGRFEPEYAWGMLNFYVQLVDDHLRDRACDDPTLGMLLVVGRDDVTVEVALRGISTPLALPSCAACPPRSGRPSRPPRISTETITRTVREVESSAPADVTS